MIAVLLQDGYMFGWNENVSTVAQSGIPFVEVESVPAEWIGKRVKYSNGAFAVEELPAPEKSLEDQIKDLQEQLAVTNATVDFLLGI